MRDVLPAADHTLTGAQIKIIPIYRNPQMQNFAGIQAHKLSNLFSKMSIAAGLMVRSKYRQMLRSGSGFLKSGLMQNICKNMYLYSSIHLSI